MRKSETETLHTVEEREGRGTPVMCWIYVNAKSPPAGHWSALRRSETRPLVSHDFITLGPYTNAPHTHDDDGEETLQRVPDWDKKCCSEQFSVLTEWGLLQRYSQ